MLRLSRKADYGLMAIHYIAVHQHDGAVSTKRIAEEFGIPAELLAKILQRLAKEKLIASVNGPKGGYVLARHPSQITVGEVIRALEGPISIVNCYRTMQRAADRALQHPAPGPEDPERRSSGTWRR